MVGKHFVLVSTRSDDITMTFTYVFDFVNTTLENKKKFIEMIATFFT